MRIRHSKRYDFGFDNKEHNRSLGQNDVIFNDSRYMSIWDGPILSFYLINNKNGKTEGLVRFHGDKTVAWSPYRAPFASLLFTGDITFEVLREFIGYINETLKKYGYRKVYLKHYPDFYSPDMPNKVISALVFGGYQLKTTDINHHIILGDKPFSSLIHPMQKRRIKKCEDNEFKFTIHDIQDTGSVYKKIQSFRLQKNIPLNIDLNTVKILFEKFPDHYKFCSVSDGKDIVAASIILKINNRVLYNFLPASNLTYSTSSPMVYLIRHMYEYARKENFKYLDLGISSINNEPQTDLIKFKERLGGIASVKFTLEKTLS